MENKQEETKKENVMPAQDEDIKERMEGFNKDIRPILAKYELGLAAVAQISPDGRVFANPILVSSRKMAEATKEQKNATPSESITNPDK